MCMHALKEMINYVWNKILKEAILNHHMYAVNHSYSFILIIISKSKVSH